MSEAMAARSIWTGSIAFGLVNIPIKVYSATEDRVFHFNQLCKNGHRIQYKRWCPTEEREVSYDEIKKGYNVAKDEYVLIEKGELQSIKVKTTRTIEIREFVEMSQLDPIFIEKSYFIGPDSKGGEKAYLLLVEILRRTKTIGLGTVVLREREQVVALRAYQRGIVMHGLHYLDEIRPMDEIKDIAVAASAKTKVEDQEMNLGKVLVEQLLSDDIDLSQYHDIYSEKVKEIIEAKAKGKEIVSVQEPAGPASTKDLLAALKASVSTKSKGTKRRG
jgi:DNA end-binding protein Ku